jgi:hypothetical protein
VLDLSTIEARKILSPKQILSPNLPDGKGRIVIYRATTWKTPLKYGIVTTTAKADYRDKNLNWIIYLKGLTPSGISANGV